MKGDERLGQSMQWSELEVERNTKRCARRPVRMSETESVDFKELGTSVITEDDIRSSDTGIDDDTSVVPASVDLDFNLVRSS
jgi:hypothetical protein